MRYVKIMLVGVLVLLPIFYYLLRPGEEDLVKKVIRQAVSAVEHGDPGGVLKHVSLNYHDEKGLSYLIIKKMLERELKSLKDIDVKIDRMDVRIIGEKALVSLAVHVTATFPDGERAYFLGSSEAPFSIELELKDESPLGWKVRTSRYGHSYALNFDKPVQALTAYITIL